MIVRPATRDDAPEIARIYSHHVLTGTGTFEEEAPTAGEMAARHARITGLGLPWFVAPNPTVPQTLLGYAYCGPYHTRSAYRFTVEDSVYVDPAATGRGLGRALLTAALVSAAAWGARTCMAVIGDGENHASRRLHERLGFRLIGIATGLGVKFGRSLDVVYMQRDIADLSPAGNGVSTLAEV